MKAPGRRRRRVKRIVEPPEGADLDALADRVRYVGSPEHKNAPSFTGAPRPRADATICDEKFISMQQQLTLWLQESVRRGIVGGPWEGDFPRYAWCRIDEDLYEARLVNKGNGDYKGYKIYSDEAPENIEEKL
ncbi:MAG: hypothetical protein ABIJ56_17995 [Pseudomonadota bacterium]